ncbi:Preprotein translocase secY subunit (TC 3.A.5.1.1) [Campylobacter coli]|nr:Preprotein translocase secY subunit (TC 3.A.5.1.1) [Campylobacter coli]
MNKALTNKILITLAFLFAYRVLAYVPVPGVNADVIAEFFNNNQNNALGLFNVLVVGQQNAFLSFL